MEEMGMTDLQFKAHLRQVIAEFERVKDAQSKGEDVSKLIDEIVERYEKAVED